MIDWCFNQTTEKIWLGTEQETKAGKFYKKRGQTEIGMHGNDEIKFEMTFDDTCN